MKDAKAPAVSDLKKALRNAAAQVNVQWTTPIRSKGKGADLTYIMTLPNPS